MTCLVDAEGGCDCASDVAGVGGEDERVGLLGQFLEGGDVGLGQGQGGGVLAWGGRGYWGGKGEGN